MSYLVETARLRFRPLTETDAPLLGESFVRERLVSGHPVRDKCAYTVIVCPSGKDTPYGYLALTPEEQDDLTFALEVSLPGMSPDLYSHALDIFTRFVPYRFGVTEVFLPDKAVLSERTAEKAGFILRDGRFVCPCDWKAPPTPDLTEKGLRLVCKRLTPPDVMRGWVSVADYDIFVRRLRVGCCSLRMGYNETLFYGGQISYTVFPIYRGHGYAAAASRLLFDYAVTCGMPMLAISCVPGNIASRRTAENAGFVCEGEYPIPKNLGMYAENRSVARRYVRKA